MKRIFYQIIVLFVSWEALLIAIAALFFFNPTLLPISVKISKEGIKYLALFPLSCAGFNLFHYPNLLMHGDNKAELLKSWPSYWKLKAHINISIFYTVIFCLISIIPFAIEIPDSWNKAWPFWLASVLGQAINSWSVYKAKITITEITI